MFDFITNAFYMLCGIICVAVSVLVVFGVVNAILKAIGRGGRNVGNKN